jgi:serine/threonine-protein kinase RsbW
MSSVPHHRISPTAIELTIPADAQYLTSARLVSTAVGADLGFSVDDLDELRIAVNEIVTIYAEALPAGGRISLCFEVATDPSATLRVTGAPADGTPRPAAIEVDGLADRILTALTDSFTVEPSGFELRKSVPRTTS